MTDAFLHEMISEGFHFRDKLEKIFCYIFVCVCVTQRPIDSPFG